MPSNLDFNSTKKFRDFILSKTLQVDGGPQEFTESDYIVQGTNSFPDKKLPTVDADISKELTIPQTKNIYKPDDYPVFQELEVLERKANLSLYPYFTSSKHTLIGIMSNGDFANESELMNFAKNYIKNDINGPVHARIQQNLETATVGRVNLIDALNGSVSTATNIITGKQPLIESNYNITVAKTLPGKAIDFLQTVSGVEFPWSEIPGNYLTDPRSHVNYRPQATTEAGKLLQDVTGTIGSMFGINRRPKVDMKPSDLLLDYTSQGQKSLLFDMLSYSTYAPNYTTVARSQNSSKVFNFIDNVAEGIKNILGTEAPQGVAYIGDDRGDDVLFAMADFNDNQVRSPFYLSLMFDDVQATLFQREKNISEFGTIPGKLTWISPNSRNVLGANNDAWNSDQSNFDNSESTNFTFRYDSILAKTQEILNSMPQNGMEARSHVANAIDQTSRFFKDGDVLMSRGSNVRYIDTKGIETGVELCRVWTKDRPYMKFSDTMRRTDTIRKYDDSVLSRPWNLNIVPISDGNHNFDGTSTNIFKSNLAEGFAAKKYMFSIENLAWKSSNTPGYTYSDLPVYERGPSGGRIMWFPPYDLKVSEQSDAKWETNALLGRPEPIYTYQTTERTGQIEFKVIVDHPSILNLLVNEEFRNMSDEDSENAINAFFSGCENIDFYGLINKYKTLTPQDTENIISFLNKGVSEKEINNTNFNFTYITNKERFVSNNYSTVQNKYKLLFLNANPKGLTELKSSFSYDKEYNSIIQEKDYDKIQLSNELYRLMSSHNSNDINDVKILFNGNSSINTTSINSKLSMYDKTISNLETDYNNFNTNLTTLKSYIEEKIVDNITINISSTTTSIDQKGYNTFLSIRRANAVFQTIYEKLSKDGSYSNNIWDINVLKNKDSNTFNPAKFNISMKFSELGYDYDGQINFSFNNIGEGGSLSTTPCGQYTFNSKILSFYSPESFGCRASNIVISYNLLDTSKNTQKNESGDKPKTQINPSPAEIAKTTKTPPIDEMKRIISKILSESYYFKKLEDTDPVVFGTLREKLKYFHPSFHSMTPEGLNSRLTFIQQCVRPGETIPIKGLNDSLDLRARNTSFGAPPICVLRVGDFFNTKVIIRNVNITYDDNLWDLNPEGIGIQPMLATVTLQVNFIGGSGIKDPVSRLQNALSSNFYANTEMYDERATNTASTIAGKDRQAFTKQFLQDLNQPKTTTPTPINTNKGTDIAEGVYIGDKSNNILKYNTIINNLFTETKNYFDRYTVAYNNIVKEYGKKMSTMLLHPKYRTINNYSVATGTTTGVTSNIELFGIYPKGRDLSRITSTFKKNMLAELDSETITTILGLDNVLTPKVKNFTEGILKTAISDFLIQSIDNIQTNPDMKDFENARNKLISALDKPNFINKYGFDISLSGNTAKEVDVQPSLYEYYSSNIDYIVNNTTKMYSDLDDSYYFLNEAVSLDDFIEFLSIFLYNNTNVLTDVINANKTHYKNKDIDSITKSINNFVTAPLANKNFNFTSFTNLKSNKDITVTINQENDVTNSSAISEAKLLFSSRVDITNNQLNYYKI